MPGSLTKKCNGFRVLRIGHRQVVAGLNEKGQRYREGQGLLAADRDQIIPHKNEGIFATPFGGLIQVKKPDLVVNLITDG